MDVICDSALESQLDPHARPDSSRDFDGRSARNVTLWRVIVVIFLLLAASALIVIMQQHLASGEDEAPVRHTRELGVGARSVTSGSAFAEVAELPSFIATWLAPQASCVLSAQCNNGRCRDSPLSLSLSPLHRLQAATR